MSEKPIAYTLGEPAGIGPDLILQLATATSLPPFVCVGDQRVLEARAKQLNLAKVLPQLEIVHVPVVNTEVAGKPDTDNAAGVLAMLDEAINGCLEQRYSAMVTGPLHKGVINDSGTPFTGHTEYLAEKTGAGNSVMLLACEAANVALVTTHLPLKDVSAAIERSKIIEVCQIVARDFKDRLGIDSPRLLVCGLNPHAGEGGHLGQEEIDTISPAIEELIKQGLNITGPVPADTAFTQNFLSQTDVVIAMYHDQGLAPIKALSFGRAANVTLGLPIIRTSVDHGTAFDLVGTGNADTGGLTEAFKWANLLSNRSR
ncbi:MAG: 4-hydroxythreonine-4-phosphate dehydrogenase PdxA [Pseudomonadota bacterium]